MKSSRFILIFVFLMLIQIVLAKYVQLGATLYFCILPALLMSIPTSRTSFYVMFVAFVCGLAVDILADGCPGLNASAAVLCAAIQKPVLSFFVDRDVVDRQYAISFKRYGPVRILSSLTVMTLVYFLMYTVVDGLGFMGFGFMMGKVFLSTLVSLPLGAIVVSTLCPYRR